MKSNRTKRVALALPLGLAFIERLLNGFLDYAKQQGNWIFTRMPEQLSPSFEWLKHWQGDGALIMITSKHDLNVARSLKMPVVNLVAYLKSTGIPSVMVNHLEIGQMAASHLLEQHFRRFGYYGMRGMYYSDQRCTGFARTIARHGGNCSTLEISPATTSIKIWRHQQEELDSWLKTLKPPVGIMASTDLRAGMVADACARLGLNVPDDVAIIGVDNDPVACEFCQPQLSSVSRNDRLVGQQAAALLDQLMAGTPPPKDPILIPPDGVIQRRSTETLAIDDPHVATAVQYIREHLNEKFGVERIIANSSLSRRRLEHHFSESMGCTPYVLINRLRVERAKQLLAKPGKQTLSRIATSCGFSELRRFRLVFRRITGKTPAQFRKTITHNTSER